MSSIIVVPFVSTRLTVKLQEIFLILIIILPFLTNSLRFSHFQA